jgi:hypothetical protein
LAEIIPPMPGSLVVRIRGAGERLRVIYKIFFLLNIVPFLSFFVKKEKIDKRLLSHVWIRRVAYF